MSVKTIFKVLLGTIVIMITSSFILELFNVSISGMQIKQMSRMAAKQACVLFTQETYKTDNSNGASSASDVKASDGTTYISGNFYESNDAMAIWNSIYTTSNFEDFCKTPEMQQYRSLKLLKMAADSGGSISIPTVSWNSSASDVQANIDATQAQMYYSNMYTTVNLGIPYMDDVIANRMFQWNIAQLLSNCDSDSIQIDEDGNYFVNYKGFRCYAQAARITNYDYEVYDLTTLAGRTDFNRATGMTVESVGVSRGLGINTSLIETTVDGHKVMDNVLVTVVGIEYEIPIAYEGITPIRRIFNFAWNHEVDGFGGTGSATYAADQQNWGSDTLTHGIGQGLQNMTGGGVTGYTYNGVNTGTNGVLPTSGKLIYTLVR